MSTSDRVCSDCGTMVDDRGCPRCWWKTPLPRIVRRTHWTLAKGAGGLPPPVAAETFPNVTPLGVRTFVDSGSGFVNHDFGPLTIRQGSALFITLVAPEIINNTIAPNDINYTFTWGARTTALATVAYDFAHIAVSKLFNVAAGTNNLVFNGDLGGLSLLTVIISELRGVKTVGALVDEQEVDTNAGSGNPPSTFATLTTIPAPDSGKKSVIYFVTETDTAHNHGTLSANLTQGQTFLGAGVAGGQIFVAESYAIVQGVSPFTATRSGFDTDTWTAWIENVKSAT